MIAGGTRDDAAAGFPAPGSSVPGAPPPLKRPLTPADGVLIASPPLLAQQADAVGHSPPARNASGSGSPLIAAAAMVGIAAGLELAGLLAGRSARRGRHKPPRH
jgi:hypothetical protein